MFAACDRHDHSVHLFDSKTGRLLKSLVGHTNSLLAVTFCPDRKYVATVSRDCSIILWDATIGNELGRIVHPGIVTAVQFSYDGRHFFTGCQDNYVRRFSTHKRRLEVTMPRLPNMELGVIVALGVQKSSSDKVIASRSNEKCAVLLEYSTLRLVRQFEGHVGLVWQAHFSFDDQFIATGCEREVRLWNALTGVMLHCFKSDSPPLEHPKMPLLGKTTKAKLWTTMTFVPPQFGNVVVLCNTDKNMLLYDVPTGKLLLNVVSRYPVFAVGSGVDDPIILYGDDAGNIGELTLS
jgi:WD40 repeat protein